MYSWTLLRSAYTALYTVSNEHLPARTGEKLLHSVSCTDLYWQHWSCVSQSV